MRVKDMLDDINANPTKATIEKYAEITLFNAVPIAFKNAANFTSIEACIVDATRQFRVLKECINEDDDKLLMFRVDVCPIVAFKSVCKNAYRELQELFNDSTK